MAMVRRSRDRETTRRQTPDARQRGRAGSNAGTKTQIRCRSNSGKWNSGTVEVAIYNMYLLLVARCS